MSSANFVAEYIQQCVTEGINNPSDIRSQAIQELEEVEAELQAKEALKIRQINLRAVIKNLGGYQIRDEEEAVMDFTTPEEDLTDSFRALCVKICDEIGKNPKGVPASTIIHDIASLEDHRNGYSAIQWLGSRHIIDRHPEDRSVIPGNNWENRPTV